MSDEVIDLHRARRRFFDDLPPYKIEAHEEIELSSKPYRGSVPLRKERFPDVESAVAKAVMLGPDHEINLCAVPRHRLPEGRNDGHILAYWHPRRRQADDRLTGYDGTAVTTRMVPLPIREPSQAWVQQYPAGEITCDAAWFFYRSRYIDEAS